MQNQPIIKRTNNKSNTNTNITINNTSNTNNNMNNSNLSKNNTSKKQLTRVLHHASTLKSNNPSIKDEFDLTDTLNKSKKRLSSKLIADLNNTNKSNILTNEYNNVNNDTQNHTNYAENSLSHIAVNNNSRINNNKHSNNKHDYDKYFKMNTEITEIGFGKKDSSTCSNFTIDERGFNIEMLEELKKENKLHNEFIMREKSSIINVYENEQKSIINKDDKNTNKPSDIDYRNYNKEKTHLFEEEEKTIIRYFNTFVNKENNNNIENINDKIECNCISYSKDSYFLACGYSNGSLVILKSETNEQLTKIKTSEYPITSIKWKNNRQKSNYHYNGLGISGAKYSNNSINNGSSTFITNTNTLLVSTSNGFIFVYFYDNSKKSLKLLNNIQESGNFINSIDISKDNCNFASGGNDKQVRVYDDNIKAVIHTFKGDYNTRSHLNRIFCVKFHPSFASMVVSGGWDKEIFFHDIREKKTLSYSIAGPNICGEAIDFNNYSIITGSWSNINQIQIWDIRKFSLIETLEDIKSKSTYVYSVKYLNNLNLTSKQKQVVDDNLNNNNTQTNNSLTNSNNYSSINSMFCFGGSSNNLFNISNYKLIEYNDSNTENNDNNSSVINNLPSNSPSFINDTTHYSDNNIKNIISHRVSGIMTTTYMSSPCYNIDFNSDLNIISTAWGDGSVRSYKLDLTEYEKGFYI